MRFAAAPTGLPLIRVRVDFARRFLAACRSFSVIPNACIRAKISATVLSNSFDLISLACFSSLLI